MHRVIHFEIHAEEPRRAIAFYEKVFGWQFQPYGPPDFYWLITTGAKDQPGIDGGMMKRQGPTPGAKAATPVIAYVCTVDVASVDGKIAEILKAGGTMALEKRAIPGLAWVAYLKDTEGNIFGIYQADANAK